MDSSDGRGAVRALLFSLKLSSGANQRKSKRTRVREIFKKRIQQGVCHNLFQEMRISDRESHFRLSAQWTF